MEKPELPHDFRIRWIETGSVVPFREFEHFACRLESAKEANDAIRLHREIARDGGCGPLTSHTLPEVYDFCAILREAKLLSSQAIKRMLAVDREWQDHMFAAELKRTSTRYPIVPKSPDSKV
jgi:hypothetical protein